MKKLEDLTFADDFMFGKVLENKEICKELLEILLDIKIEKIEFPEIQKELSASYKSKSIRLDVFASDPKRNFDIEMVAILRLLNKFGIAKLATSMSLLRTGSAPSETRILLIFVLTFGNSR